MPTVTEIARQIVAREGGFVNDPADPGGATNHGVTLATLRRIGLDLNRDGKISEGDLRKLTPEQAADIYVEHYFRRAGLAALPECLQATVFDMQVNAGANAVLILQRLLNEMGFACGVDGKCGAQTARAAHQAADAAPHHLADAYGIARRNYYYALGDARPASRKFARTRNGAKGGWITRAEEFISPKYHLTDSQHRERTAQWA